MSDIDKEIADGLDQLNPGDLQYMAKLVCLLLHCPGFNKELKKIIPISSGAVSCEQLAATDDLTNKWLWEEGWAEILRPELVSAGVVE